MQVLIGSIEKPVQNTHTLLLNLKSYTCLLDSLLISDRCHLSEQPRGLLLPADKGHSQHTVFLRRAAESQHGGKRLASV